MQLFLPRHGDLQATIHGSVHRHCPRRAMSTYCYPTGFLRPPHPVRGRMGSPLTGRVPRSRPRSRRRGQVRVNYISLCNNVCGFRTRSCNNACEVVDKRPWGPPSQRRVCPRIQRIVDVNHHVAQHIPTADNGAILAVVKQSLTIICIPRQEKKTYRWIRTRELAKCNKQRYQLRHRGLQYRQRC